MVVLVYIFVSYRDEIKQKRVNKCPNESTIRFFNWKFWILNERSFLAILNSVLLNTERFINIFFSIWTKVDNSVELGCPVELMAWLLVEKHN